VKRLNLEEGGGRNCAYSPKWKTSARLSVTTPFVFIYSFIYLPDDAFFQVLGLHSIGYRWNGLERRCQGNHAYVTFQNHRGICPTKPQDRRSLNDSPYFRISQSFN